MSVINSVDIYSELPSNNTMPNKIVDKFLYNLQQKVVIGSGLITAIVAITYSSNSNHAKRVLRVLLDSGSDGDLLFLYDGDKLTPTKKRISPQKWRTSNGTFKTTEVGDLKVTFPEFSNSKRASFRPDVIRLPKNSPKPVYDLIIGVQSLANLGCILDFASKSLTIDSVQLPMRPQDSFMDPKTLRTQFKEFLEPISMREATNRAVKILDSKYEKANLEEVVHKSCTHLTSYQQSKLISLLREFEELFDGTLGDFQTAPVSLELLPDAKPYHGRPYPIPHIHLDTLKKEIKRLCMIGVLKKQPQSEWASPTYIVAKKQGTPRVLSDFRQVNKRIKRNPYPIPKISSVLQEMEGFTFATQLDLNMGYYTIRLDPDAQKICTIIFPWGKYSYLRLPMGISCAPDIFQEKMSTLMETLEYVKTYIDDLLVITKSDFDDHLAKLRKVLRRLHEAKLRINAPKSTFAMQEVEYLGYILSRVGIKPMPEKVSAILAISPPKNVRELRRFLGIVQYYRDMWVRRSHLLAPLTNLVGECGYSKVSKALGTKKKPWHWDTIHMQAFDGIKNIVARETMLSYPDYSEVFEIHTDASDEQLGAVISQKGKPLAFFSRKFSKPQRNYTVTDKELLSICEVLKEFHGMLWGQRIKVYTDHQNLIRDAIGSSSSRVQRWRLLLEEYGPEIVYIKGIDNTVADALSRLEYNPDINVKDLSFHVKCSFFAQFLAYYPADSPAAAENRETYVPRSNTNSSARRPPAVGEVPTSTQLSQNANSGQSEIYNHSVSLEECHNDNIAKNIMTHVFANYGDSEEEIYPVTISEIAEAQRKDKKLKPILNGTHQYDPKDKMSLRVFDDIDVIVYNEKRLVIPKPLQSKILQWYHHYLLHPGHTRLEETVAATMYWKSLRSDVRRHVKTCIRCQKGKKRKQKYGKLPAKIAETTPWRCVCVDLIGPYTLKGKDGTILDFMCLTMIDPATAWFEIIELPLASVVVKRDGDEITEIVIDKTAAQVSRLFNKQWLCRYPRPKYCIYDNGSEFKSHFSELCITYSIERKPTTVKNPQANAILERVHGVFGDMLRTSGLDMSETVTNDDVDDFLTNAAWAIRSTHHTVLQSTPAAAVFGRDMLFDIPFQTDWAAVGRRRQELVDRNSARENARRIDYDYRIGQKVLLRLDGILRKAQDRKKGPYVITDVFTNGTVRIQRGTWSERLNIRRIEPFFE